MNYGSSAQQLQYNVYENDERWKPSVLVWVKTAATGIRCRVFGRNPIDGCRKSGLRSFLNNYDEFDAQQAYLKYCKRIDPRLACERSAWNDHIHIGCYDEINSLALPAPYQEVTDMTMINKTREAVQQYRLQEEGGYQLTTRQERMQRSAESMHAHAQRMREITIAQNDNILCKTY